jgi:hypothetical protein
VKTYTVSCDKCRKLHHEESTIIPVVLCCKQIMTLRSIKINKKTNIPNHVIQMLDKE